MTIMLFWMLVSVIISVVIVAIAIQKRDAPKSFYFLIISILNALFVLGRYFEAIATSLDAALHATILGYLGMPYVPVFLLLFIMDYYDIKTSRLLKVLLLIPPSFIILLISTPPLRQYYYRNYSFYPGPPIAQLMVEGTLIYYMFFSYFFLLTAVCLAFPLLNFKKNNKAERWASLALFFAGFIPLIAGILYILRLTPLNLDMSQFAICFSVIFLGVAVYRMNLLKILPLAKDTILEQMTDAYIIFDHENRYVESNSAAKNLFPAIANLSPGQKAEPEEIFPPLTEGLDGRIMVPIMVDNALLHYHLSKTEISQKEKRLGICYTLHDVTDTRKLLSELKLMATYDSLTNIYNRASFYDLTAHALEIARGQETPICAFEIDIDHFKIINDTYGHLCGDEILKTLVNKIAGRLRDADIFGRIGGEEFTVLLPNTNLENAMILAQDLQKMVDAEPFIFGDHQIRVTISIGVALYDAQRHADFEHLFIDVDSALYEAKEKGRNRVCFHGPD